FLVGTHMADLTRLAGLRRLLQGWLFVGVYNVLQIASCIAAVIGAHRVRLRTHSRNWDYVAASAVLQRSRLLLRFRCSWRFAFVAPEYPNHCTFCGRRMFPRTIRRRGVFPWLHVRTIVSESSMGFLVFSNRSFSIVCARTCLPKP